MSVYLQPRNPIGSLTKLEFPYTPQIEYSTEVKYNSFDTTHTIYQLYAYTKTESPTITLNCKFSAHTEQHFRQSEYAIRFLRTYTKMNYGRTDMDRGQTPRILRFYAYGTQVFENVPVVITRFNMTFPDDVDYVSGQFSDNTLVGVTPVPANQAQTLTGTDVRNSRSYQTPLIYLPIFFQISISLNVQQNLYKTVTEFNLNDFAAGKLSSKGYI